MRNIKSYYGDHQLNFKADNLKSLQILRPLALSITQVTYVSTVEFTILQAYLCNIPHNPAKYSCNIYISVIIEMCNLELTS